MQCQGAFTVVSSHYASTILSDGARKSCRRCDTLFWYNAQFSQTNGCGHMFRFTKGQAWSNQALENCKKIMLSSGICPLKATSLWEKLLGTTTERNKRAIFQHGSQPSFPLAPAIFPQMMSSLESRRGLSISRMGLWPILHFFCELKLALTDQIAKTPWTALLPRVRKQPAIPRPESSGAGQIPRRALAYYSMFTHRPI